MERMTPDEMLNAIANTRACTSAFPLPHTRWKKAFDSLTESSRSGMVPEFDETGMAVQFPLCGAPSQMRAAPPVLHTRTRS